jgi:hypothetical protein
MTPAARTAIPGSASITNGSGAAAVLAAGIGCLALALLAIAGDRSAALKSALAFYRPTGPLSGVSTVAILVWLCTWVLLHLLWRKKTVPLPPVSLIAFVMLILSFLLTFPPIADLL